MAKRNRKSEPGDSDGDSGFSIETETNAVVVRVPVNFYRRNGRQMILAKDDASGNNQQQTPAPNNALAANLAKAWMWQEQLESGEYSNLDELGRANGVDRTYVSRILKLTSLSPSVADSILTGDETSGMSLRLLRHGIPVLWERQLSAGSCG